MKLEKEKEQSAKKKKKKDKEDKKEQPVQKAAAVADEFHLAEEEKRGSASMSKDIKVEKCADFLFFVLIPLQVRHFISKESSV